MYDYLTHQYNLWSESPQYLAVWKQAVAPVYQELNALLPRDADYLKLEAACNAYAAAAERHGFFAGYAWFLSFCRAAASYFPDLETSPA